MAKLPKRTKTTSRVLAEFLKNPTGEIHGFDLVKTTGIKSGTLYPLLIRLENLGWITSRWEESERAGPRKRMYRLSAEGEPAVHEYMTPVEEVQRGRLQSLPPFPREASA